MRWRAKPLICFWSSYVVFMSSAWKNVIMIMYVNELFPRHVCKWVHACKPQACCWAHEVFIVSLFCSGINYCLNQEQKDTIQKDALRFSKQKSVVKVCSFSVIFSLCNLHDMILLAIVTVKRSALPPHVKDGELCRCSLLLLSSAVSLPRSCRWKQA